MIQNLLENHQIFHFYSIFITIIYTPLPIFYNKLYLLKGKCNLFKYTHVKSGALKKFIHENISSFNIIAINGQHHVFLAHFNRNSQFFKWWWWMIFSIKTLNIFVLTNSIKSLQKKLNRTQKTSPVINLQNQSPFILYVQI